MPLRQPHNCPDTPEPPLYPGDPAPWFVATSDLGGDFPFSGLAGRWTILAFVDAADHALIQGFKAGFAPMAAAADGGAALVFVVSTPPIGVEPGPHARFLFDPDGSIATRYGVAAKPTTFILEPDLRIATIVRDLAHPAHAHQALARFSRRPALGEPRAAARQAPVLLVERVFEPEFRAALIAGHQGDGGRETGFMVERDGRTIEVVDHQHKRRTDWLIEDLALQAQCRMRVQRRLVPELQRAFQFHATRIERYLVARYDSETGGHFAPHRDNTTAGTAHRRFAISLNLNDDFEGGDLVFPEFGRARYRPPAGGACVFSCSVLHQATPVTLGQRFVFVPFLYDDPAALIRDANRHVIGPMDA